MNIHDLDGRLYFGNQKQIAVLKALQEGWPACSECGDIHPPGELAGAGLCNRCWFIAEEAITAGDGEQAPDVVLKFRKGNKIPYRQNFESFTGIPSGIEFSVEWITDQSVKLAAPGYGKVSNAGYGNGPLYAHGPWVLRRARKANARKVAEEAVSP